MPLLGLLVVVGFSSALIYVVKAYFLDQPTRIKKTVQLVTLIQPPPPPPEIEPPPEPEMKQKIEQEKPEEVPDEVPEALDEPLPGDDLGLDAEGTAGGDAFGLIGKKGGRGLLAGGVEAWYKGIIQQDLKELLYDRVEQMKARTYSIKLKLLIRPDGGFSLLAMENSTGDPQLDALLKSVLNTGRFSEIPPRKLAGVVRIQINSRI